MTRLWFWNIHKTNKAQLAKTECDDTSVNIVFRVHKNHNPHLSELFSRWMPGEKVQQSWLHHSLPLRRLYGSTYVIRQSLKKQEMFNNAGNNTEKHHSGDATSHLVCVSSINTAAYIHQRFLNGIYERAQVSFFGDIARVTSSYSSWTYS